MRRLPNGEYTDDLNVYLESWERFAQPLVDKTGWKLIGFDPGFQFMSETQLVVSLPLWAVADLIARKSFSSK
jgi:hypothetical protein